MDRRSRPTAKPGSLRPRAVASAASRALRGPDRHHDRPMAAPTVAARGVVSLGVLYRHPRAPARAAPRGAAGLARHRLPRLAHVPLCSRLSGGSTRSPAISCPSRPSTTSRALDDDVYRTIAVRTVRFAAAVTITDASWLPDRLLHGAGRIAADAGPPRRLDPAAAVVGLPRQGLRLADDPPRTGSGNGSRAAGDERAGPTATCALWLVFGYLWLPFMILPIYAGLERIPRSLLEASSDLGGRAGRRSDG